jgi:hypothetical protein
LHFNVSLHKIYGVTIDRPDRPRLSPSSPAQQTASIHDSTTKLSCQCGRSQPSSYSSHFKFEVSRISQLIGDLLIHVASIYSIITPRSSLSRDTDISQSAAVCRPSVLSSFLYRKYNPAYPETDTGISSKELSGPLSVTASFAASDSPSSQGSPSRATESHTSQSRLDITHQQSINYMQRRKGSLFLLDEGGGSINGGNTSRKRIRGIVHGRGGISRMKFPDYVLLGS